jgi:CheY-like chemotaxis protein
MSYVNDISISSHSLLGIINDILDMSKIESGKLELNPIDFCLLQLLDNVTSMFRYIANSKEIEFRFEVDENVPHYIFADDIRLKQVLVNICSNAVKFTFTGYVKLSVKTENRNLVFTIQDTGIGIRKESIPNLFNAYEQADKVKNREIAGTGLGLSISKSFVEMMGGKISVESRYGVGTVFTVSFPLARVRSNSKDIKKDKYTKTEQTLSAPNARVLVVDDNEFNLRVSDGLLNIMEIDCETADSGFKAIELITANKYDVVFMDHMMPDMDGVETVRKIRDLGGRYCNLPIIALTANAVAGAKEMFLANGFNDFISKPIDSSQLTVILKEWLPPDKVTVVNKDKDAAKSDSSSKIQPDLVRFFNQRLMSECAKMSGFLGEDNLNEFAVTIHAMKSSLAIIGETLLCNVAQELETAAKKGRLKYCREYYQKLQVRLNELHQRLNVMYPPEKPTSKTQSGDKSVLRKSVKAAINAADDFDGDAGVERLRYLIKLDFGKEVNESVAAALEAFEDFDFERATGILKKLI